MKQLIDVLNHASKVYYQGQDEEMSNFQYDALYDELVALEEKTKIVMAVSYTHLRAHEPCRVRDDQRTAKGASCGADALAREDERCGRTGRMAGGSEGIAFFETGRTQCHPHI